MRRRRKRIVIIKVNRSFTNTSLVIKQMNNNKTNESPIDFEKVMLSRPKRGMNAKYWKT